MRRSAMASSLKGKSSIVIYALAIPMAFLQVWIAYGLYIAVAVAWLIPDRRIERVLEEERRRRTERAERR